MMLGNISKSDQLSYCLRYSIIYILLFVILYNTDFHKCI